MIMFTRSCAAEKRLPDFDAIMLLKRRVVEAEVNAAWTNGLANIKTPFVRLKIILLNAWSMSLRRLVVRMRMP